MSNVERRTITNEFEVRAVGNATTIVGYASVFNSLSQNLGGFVEQVAPGAFKKTILEADVRALFNHDPNFVLGRNKAGTLRMMEDGKGLAYEVDLPDTQQARDLAESMRRGDISQSSFGFRVIRDSWGVTGDDYPLRTLEEVALYDVSPVTYPAYTEASSALRSLAKMSNTDIGTLVDAGAAGELRAYIMGEAPSPNQMAIVKAALDTLVEYCAAESHTFADYVIADEALDVVESYIEGEIPAQDMPEEIVVEEDQIEVPEQRGSSDEVDKALVVADAEKEGPNTVHLSSQEASRLLRDAKAKEMALRLRITGR